MLPVLSASCDSNFAEEGRVQQCYFKSAAHAFWTMQTEAFDLLLLCHGLAVLSDIQVAFCMTLVCIAE